MVGRGVLLDVARHLKQPFLTDGTAITCADLEATAAAQNVAVGRGDFVIVRTGQMEQRLAAAEWGGYAGGDAPCLAFETAEWIHRREIAAASDLLICGLDQFKCEMAAARALALPISIHSNTWEFPERILEVALPQQHGLLGPDLLFVHTNLSTDEEIRVIADSGGWIASTPETEMQMSMGPAVIGRWTKAGGLPFFGCDIISNNSGDLPVQARLALQTQRMLDNVWCWPPTGAQTR